MSLIFPCSALSATLVAQQRRQFAFRSLALRSLIGRLVGGGIGIAAAILGAGLWSLVLQQILIAAIGSFVLWIMADRRRVCSFATVNSSKCLDLACSR